MNANPPLDRQDLVTVFEGHSGTGSTRSRTPSGPGVPARAVPRDQVSAVPNITAWIS